MKIIKLFTLGLLLFVSNSMFAQVSVNVNIGAQPKWGPVGYNEAEYYYIPDIETYYDVRSSQYIYYGNGKWVRSSYLPRQHRHYDLYNGHKVVLTDYHGNSPYEHYKEHKIKYYKGYKNGNQKTIGVKAKHHKKNYGKHKGHKK